MATALATIGKFVVKKKAGEGDALFGTVTAADVCDALDAARPAPKGGDL